MLQKDYFADNVVSKFPREVFDYISDMNNFPAWTGVTAVEVIATPNEESELGKVYKLSTKALFSTTVSTIEVVEYNSPFTWGIKTQEEPICTSIYSLEETEEGTKISLKYTEEQKKLSLVADMSIKYRMERLLGNLKKVLE